MEKQLPTVATTTINILQICIDNQSFHQKHASLMKHISLSTTRTIIGVDILGG
ncbi:MAG: hypothetical protein JNJ57_09465 [Saprospiraceae bacterium]|nr:hypothetical protein [Saprospiraceae bacterium]